MAIVKLPNNRFTGNLPGFAKTATKQHEEIQRPMPEVIGPPAVRVALVREATWKPRDHDSAKAGFPGARDF